MGLSIDKIQPDDDIGDAPLLIANSNKAGTLYFVQHKQNQPSNVSYSDKDESSSEKRCHHAFAIDITGSSTENLFRAVHFDLRVNSATDHRTFITLRSKEHEWDHYAKV